MVVFNIYCFKFALRTDSFKYFYIKVIGILILAKILFMFSAGMMAYLRGVGMIQHIEELFYNVQKLYARLWGYMYMFFLKRRSLPIFCG